MTNWTFRYLDLAEHIAGWSKDGTKVGAVAVGSVGQILSQGYNGYPRGIEDKLDVPDEVRYRLMVHAEANVIYNAPCSLRGSDLYVHGCLICTQCAKAIIQAGFSRVFVRPTAHVKPLWKKEFSFTVDLFRKSGSTLEVYQP